MTPRKLFIVKKYVMASCAAEAMRIEKKQLSDEVWIDEDWKKAQSDAGSNVMGSVPKRRKPRRKHG